MHSARLPAVSALALVAAVVAGAPVRADSVATKQIAAPATAPSSAAGSAGAIASPPCSAPAELTRLAQPLTHTARMFAGGLPIKIIAIGSSSTAGAGASSDAATYPSRLAVELTERFPGQKFTVLNRGANGEEAKDMVARFQTGVIAERPDLVLWQVGTNTVLRGHPLSPASSLIEEGVARLKAAGADVILIDPQFAPKVIAKTDAQKMVELLAAKAKQYNVNLFRRFAMMRHWQESQGIGFETFVSPDQLHMNDWSYACVAKALAIAIAEALTRPTASAAAQPAR